MENQGLDPDPVNASMARDHLRDARRAHDASVRRATGPAWLTVVVSVFCGVQSVAPAYRGPGSVVTIVAMVLLLAGLLRTAARMGWRPMRSWPRPKWNVAEMALIVVAVIVGGAVGPHLADNGDSAVASWALGAAVAAMVALCFFGACASYRHRVSRVWPG